MELFSLIESVINEAVDDSQDSGAIGGRHETAAAMFINKAVGANQPVGLNGAHAEYGRGISSNIVKQNVDRHGAETGQYILNHQKSLGITPTHCTHVGKEGELADIKVHGTDVNGESTVTKYSLKRNRDKKTKLPQASTIKRSNEILGTNTPNGASREQRITDIHKRLDSLKDKPHELVGLVNRIAKNNDENDTKESVYEVKNQSNIRERNNKASKMSVVDTSRRFHPDNVRSVTYDGMHGKYTAKLKVHVADNEGNLTTHNISIHAHNGGHKTQFDTAEER